MKSIIVEGGAMRGVFPAGVLKSFADHNFNDFQLYIGVSSGACNLTSYLSGNHDRNYGAYIELMSQKRFISWRKFLLGKDLMDLDWLWEELAHNYPINEQLINKGHKEFIAVATNVDTGLPAYLKPGPSNIYKVLLASSGVPIVYRNFTKIFENRFTDGVVSDPLPIQYAIDRGAKEILLLRTRPADYRSKDNLMDRAWSLFLMKYPKLRISFDNHNKIYNDSIEVINNTHQGITVHQICPPETMKTERMSQDVQNLIDDYHLGYKSGLKFMDEQS
jgi:predicted patatin/cPLA2 family phospholipase